MSYMDIYNLRLNRFGLDYQSRIQKEREKLFDLYLLKSTYRLDFSYNDEIYPGSFEKYKQDETKTLHYLLTYVSVDMPNGTILMLADKDGVEEPWMVYYLEDMKASGYNRYVMLRMTHLITWRDRQGTEQTSWAYMYGQENNMLKDELQARSRMDTRYDENLKSSFFVMPRNQFLKKDDYFIIGEEPFQEYYRVTGYDLQSNKGVQFVTVDPVYEYDLTAAPIRQETDDPKDFYWLEGGN